MSAPNLQGPSACHILNRLEVRPIRRGEREQWDGLMRSHHYRGFRALVGKALRYVALLDGRWVALLGWQSAALKCRARDHWIGWSAVLQYQRLHLLANNGRFLILPGCALPNLASRVLALNVKRLSRDWQQTHGHPILLAETFVETPRFSGACYRAANWQDVGITRGYARRPDGYSRHDEPKRILLYPLHRHARRWLASAHPHPAWSQTMQPVRLSSTEMEALHQRLRGLPDCRHRRGIRHHFASTLTIAMAAMLGGAASYTAMGEWAGRLTQAQLKRVRAHFDRRSGRFVPPSESTLRRVLQAADADALDGALGQWLLECGGNDCDPPPTVAADGKTAKGAVRPDGSPVHLLSAFLSDAGCTVAQREVEAKSNEIPALPQLLEPLDIAGATVTADAMHTQRETARFIVEDKQADYLFTAVKDNQPTLLADLQALPWGRFPPRR